MSMNLAALIAAALIALPAAPEGDSPAPSLGKQLSDEHMAAYSDGGMARWQAAMTPGRAHEFLREKFAGSWKLSAQANTGQGMGPASEWTCEGTPMLGGRYVEMHASGTMHGMPMESITVLGYDNVRKLFHATMYDTIGTGVHTLWGNLDESGNVLTFVGPMDEPMTGEIGKSFMFTYTFNEDGSHDYLISEILYGDPIPVVKAHAERVPEDG